METKKTSSQGAEAVTPAQAREERLKAALKSNMARRKAQARIRKASGKESDTEQGQ